MTTESWKDLTHRTDTLPGPKAFFACGYGSEQVNMLRTFLDELGYEEVPIRVCRKAHLDHPLAESLAEDVSGALLPEGALPYTLILSGLTPKDVESVLHRFKQVALPRPIFATTTERNLDFTVKTLLRHLLEEKRMAAAGR